MRLATLRSGGRDGRLVVVAPDGLHAALAPVATLQEAVEDWGRWGPLLRAVDSFPLSLDPAELAAPLPRAWQWLDGSAFPSHGELMDRAFGRASTTHRGILMYQGLSDCFLGPRDDVPFPDESLGIDFEGEFAVITDEVPMGTSVSDAAAHILLVVQVNDWSLRSLAREEIATGFGFVQAKPACGMAPFAVTPDELGDQWAHCRAGLALQVQLNGERFGEPLGDAMAYGFDVLVAHAARTRRLPAGTIIGSGTVSNADHERVGSTCIAERRSIEIIAGGQPVTDYLHFGDVVRMRAVLASGEAPFGTLEQRVVRAT